MGCGTHALLDQPRTTVADPVGKESRELSGLSAFSIRTHHLAYRRGSRIGSKSALLLRGLRSSGTTHRSYPCRCVRCSTLGFCLLRSHRADVDVGVDVRGAAEVPDER